MPANPVGQGPAGFFVIVSTQVIRSKWRNQKIGLLFRVGTPGVGLNNLLRWIS